MDPETKKLLTDSLAVSKENNEMLKRMVRAQKLTNMYRIFYWSVIILSSIGAMYFIQPLLANLFNVYTGGVSNTSNVGDVVHNLSNKQQLEDLMNALKK